MVKKKHNDLPLDPLGEMSDEEFRELQAKRRSKREEKERSWQSISTKELDAAILRVFEEARKRDTEDPWDADEVRSLVKQDLATNWKRLGREVLPPGNLTVKNVRSRLEAPETDEAMERIRRAVLRLEDARELRVVRRFGDGEAVYALAKLQYAVSQQGHDKREDEGKEPKVRQDLVKLGQMAAKPSQKGRPPRGFSDQRFKLEQVLGLFHRIKGLSTSRARELIANGDVEGIKPARPGKGYWIEKSLADTLRNQG